MHRREVFLPNRQTDLFWMQITLAALQMPQMEFYQSFAIRAGEPEVQHNRFPWGRPQSLPTEPAAQQLETLLQSESFVETRFCPFVAIFSGLASFKKKQPAPFLSLSDQIDPFTKIVFT
jgi:hypothetical protein